MINRLPESFSVHNHIEITDVDEGWAKCRLEIHPDTMNLWGFPHGGALFSLVDVAAGTAAFTLRQDLCVTVQSNVEFLAPAPTTGSIWGEGKVLRCGRKLCFCQADLCDEAGSLLVHASVIMSFSTPKPETDK